MRTDLHLPSPLDVPPVCGTWDGAVRERAADPAAPFAALVFKVNSTATGRLSYLRVYSGTIQKGGVVQDAGARRTERIGRILRVQADRHTEVDRAVAGDIVAVVGLKAARTGATLCVPGAALVLEPPTAADPVVSVAVEPRRSVDTERLTSALARMVEEDPSLGLRTDAETGQIVLSGMGELHLEVAVEKIRRSHGLEVNVGRPQVAYRETVVRGVSGLLYRHVKQDGGAGQYAHVVLDVAPLAATADPTVGDPGGQAPDFAFGSTVVVQHAGHRMQPGAARGRQRYPAPVTAWDPVPGDGSPRGVHARSRAGGVRRCHRPPTFHPVGGDTRC